MSRKPAAKPSARPADPVRQTTSSRRRPVARNAKLTSTTTTTAPVEDFAPETVTATDTDSDSPRALVPRRPPPVNTPSAHRAANNLITALGGPAAVIPRLRASGRKKAVTLADIMSDAKFDTQDFYYKIHQVGWNLVEFTEALLDVSNAAAVARLVMHSERVAEEILEKATDQIIPHISCLASGRILNELEDGSMIPTNTECFQCQGSGYILRSADGEWVDRYLELVMLRKNAPLVSLTRNMTTNNQNLNVYGDLVHGDDAPAIDKILKRADDQALPPPPKSLTDGSESALHDLPTSTSNMSNMMDAPMTMPEDDVVEAEVVVPVAPTQRL